MTLLFGGKIRGVVLGRDRLRLPIIVNFYFAYADRLRLQIIVSFYFVYARAKVSQEGGPLSNVAAALKKPVDRDDAGPKWRSKQGGVARYLARKYNLPLFYLGFRLI